MCWVFQGQVGVFVVGEFIGRIDIMSYFLLFFLDVMFFWWMVFVVWDGCYVDDVGDFVVDVVQ